MSAATASARSEYTWVGAAPDTKPQPGLRATDCYRTPRTLAIGITRLSGELTPTDHKILCHLFVATKECLLARVQLNRRTLAVKLAIGLDHLDKRLKSLVEYHRLVTREIDDDGTRYGIVGFLRAEVLAAGKATVKCGNCNTAGKANTFFFAPKALFNEYMFTADQRTFQVVLAVCGLSMSWDKETETVVAEWIDPKIAKLAAITGYSQTSVEEALDDAEDHGAIEIQRRKGRSSLIRVIPAGLKGGEPREPRTVDRSKSVQKGLVESAGPDVEPEEETKDPDVEPEEDKIQTDTTDCGTVRFNLCRHCQFYGAVQMVFEGMERPLGNGQPQPAPKPTPSPPKPSPNDPISPRIPTAEQPLYEGLRRYTTRIIKPLDPKLTHEIWLKLGGVRLTSAHLQTFLGYCEAKKTRLRPYNWGLFLNWADDIGSPRLDNGEDAAAARLQKAKEAATAANQLQEFLGMLDYSPDIPDSDLELMCVARPEIRDWVERYKQQHPDRNRGVGAGER